MTSFFARIVYRHPPHVDVQVFAGPTEHARALTGTLVMREGEADDFFELLKRAQLSPEPAPAP